MGKQHREDHARWVQLAPREALGFIEEDLELGMQPFGELVDRTFGNAARSRGRRWPDEPPITSAVFDGRTKEEPTGMERSLPPMPTGTMGTLAPKATKAGPRNSSLNGWAPSGGSLQGRGQRARQRRAPARTSEEQTRSGVPRFTGKLPSELKTFAIELTEKTPSFAMKRMRRSVMRAVRKVSMLERCTGEMM